MDYLTVPLSAGHDRKNFVCGKPVLDRYLQKQAKQDMKRKLAVTFICPDGNGQIKGYYSLANDSIPRSVIPENIAKNLPYENLPVTLLGRLAIDQKHHGQGLGRLLLIDALRRCYDISANDIGSMAVVVDPLDKEAVSFYQKYGFIMLPDRGRMFLPMKTISPLFMSDHN